MTEYLYEPNADELNYFNFHRAGCNCVSAHFHRSTEMLFVLEGEIRVVVNGVDRLLHAGDISVANSYDVHYYQSVGNSTVYILLFGDSYLNGSEFSGKCFENFLPACKKHELIFRFLRFYDENVTEPNFALRQGMVNIILGLIADCDGFSVKKRSESNTFVEVLTYLDLHYREDLTLEKLASHFGYTKNYFSMMFNKLTGKHFREYLNELRMEKMNKLMSENKNMTVTYAALTSGFGSLNSYYRAAGKKKS